MRMLDRRRARSTPPRTELLPDRLRDSSFWMPALRAAAAARECGGVWVRGGEGLEGLRSCSVMADVMRVGIGVLDGDGEGGSELMSGGMVCCTTQTGKER